MSQALYRKWRPQKWDQVIGQQHVVQTLKNAVAADRIAHAYLFSGPRGTGKTTTARLLAKAANCLEADLTLRPCDKCEHCLSVNQGRFLDLIEIDAASNTSVDDVRALREKINFSPNQGRFKIYIIDEVHMLSTAAFNALLKTLEEPPPHAIFILATTEIHKIPATVLSRCQRHEFRRIPVIEIVGRLDEIVRAEGLDATGDGLQFIARQSTGSLRDAISLLDQLASTGEKITLDLTQNILGTAAYQSVAELVDCIAQNNPAKGLDAIQSALDAGSDPRQFARQAVDRLRNILLSKMENGERIDATAEEREHIARQAGKFTVNDLLRMIRIFNQAASETRNSWQPSLPLELALLEALADEDEPQLPKMRASAGAFPPGSKNTQATAVKASKPKPTPETLAPDPAETPVTGDGVTLEGVSKMWHTILGRLRELNRTTEALLKSGSLLGIKNGTIYLGFSSEVLKSKMERDDNLNHVRKAFEEVLEQEVLVRCVVAAGKAGRLPPDIDGDGMVAAALRDLGGEIVDVL